MKNVIGVVAGLAAWIAVVAVAGLIMRSSWPAYARVADAMTFTLPMMLARLSIGAVATLAAGWVTAALAPRPLLVRVIPGIILLAVLPTALLVKLLFDLLGREEGSRRRVARNALLPFWPTAVTGAAKLKKHNAMRRWCEDMRPEWIGLRSSLQVYSPGKVCAGTYTRV